MPPRRTGQLDQISEAIGELRGMVVSLDRYTHEREHSLNNLSQKIEALGTKITRDIAAVEARIEAKVDSFVAATNERLVALEKAHQQQAGARNLATWFLQSPLVGWLVAAGLFVAAWWKGEIR